MTVPHTAHVACTPYHVADPLARRKEDAGEADYLAVTLEGDFSCELVLGLVPCLAIDCCVHAADRSYARIVQLGNRRSRRSWGRRDFAPTEKVPRWWAFSLESGL